ncbi:putative serine protease family S33 [Phytophthora cinnamomi]|uniref:putative serine protease family S33 n=1 Tax=Phytophthora cinnamomi TaxID=4785 RepID=UPI00355951F5|nr:putative serine protease family S33 [Phytophthora cinnamomi]
MKAAVRCVGRAARQRSVASFNRRFPRSLIAQQQLVSSTRPVLAAASFSTITDSAAAGKPRRPSSPPLPEPKFIDVDGKCTIEYIDVKPEDLTAATPTLVLIHGAPGTYRDFRHIIPLLKYRGVRVVGVNLPGFAGSTVLDTTNYYEHISAVPSVQLTYRAMQGVLKDSDNVFVLGHSFGAHAAVHFTGINADEQQIGIKGLVLLAGAGHRPHHALSPRLIDLLWKMLRSGVPAVETASKWLVRQLYIKSFKFPDSKLPDYFTAGIVRCATADFALFAQHLEKNRSLPSFLAWAKDDALIEEDIFLDVGAVCHPGPRLAFERGGHNVQKTKASFLADELAAWMQNVVQGKERGEVYSTSVDIHP